MIDPEASAAIQETPEAEDLTLVFRWPAASPDDASGGTPQERLLKVQGLLSEKKAPILGVLTQVAGMRVNNLGSLPVVTVTATGAAWRRLVDRHAPLLNESEARLSVNERFHAK